MNLTRLQLPHTLVLIGTIILVVAALTWVIPGGRYHRRIDENGREVVDGGTFAFVERKPQGLFAVLKAPLLGIRQTADIIGFILIIGGVFAIIQQTKVVDAAIARVAHRLRHRGMLVIPAGMLLFSLFGAVFGMSEEVIPFVPIFIPLALALGYDSIVGVCIPFLGAGLGFAGAMLNPFTIGIAQGISGLPLFSGMGYRILVWLLSTALGIALVMLHAARVRKKPESSPVYLLDQTREKIVASDDPAATQLTRRHKAIVVLFVLALVVMIVGVMRFRWFIPEIAAVFLGLGIATGIAARLSLNSIADSFVAGARDLVGAALVVGFARAILVVATDGQIVDTLMYALSNAIARLHPVFAAQLMYVAQTVLNFFVPSGSGKAALTMPIMAPLADLIGITRQTAVLAYQLGDGYTNMIIPTSGVTMAVLGMARIPWEQWARWLLPIEIALFVLGLLLVIPPVLLHWGPF
ncbi:MAG: TIGR00366 family protein [candidate division KSB1 bacterium]|nr:TIGR00366 family protein [candidate division KSB1 bacterium]